jgi:hypothetical protein
MPPLTLWKGVNVKTNDYKFIDRSVGEYFRVSGTEIWVHKYMGPIAQPATGDATINAGTNPVPELNIQDVLNMEIRDRKYDPDVYSLKGHYQVSDTEFDLRQFGLFLSNDTIFITFHLNDMVNSIGRTLMSGDVLEILHRRDDLVLGSDVSISKYYVIQEGTRPAEGWSPTWWSHIWRVKCTPMTDSQEYKDILNQAATDINGDPVPNKDGTGVTTLKDLLSTYKTEIAIGDAVVAQAEAEVPFRNLQGAQFYVLSGDIGKPVTIWAGDGIPPNHSKPVASGNTFPVGPAVGDYFLRTDYLPSMLFRRDGINGTTSGKWVRCEINWRDSWQPANRVLTSFINNTTQTTLKDGSVIPEQQDLRTALKAKLDPDII